MHAVMFLNDSASIAIILPPNSSFVDIVGLVAPKGQTLHVDIRPPPPGNIRPPPPSFGDRPTLKAESTFWDRSTSRPSYALESFFSLSLDSSILYNVTLTVESHGVFLSYIKIIPFYKQA